MNRALEIISLQHELAMAVGNDIRLSEMITHFMRVCRKRFNLAGVHTFLFCDEYGQAQNFQENEELELRHYLSIPVKHDGLPWKKDKQLFQIAQSVCLEKGDSCQILNERYYHAMLIPHHGCVIFESVARLDELILRSLKPIFKKLATSCMTSVTHDVLKKEVTARKLAEDLVVHQANHDTLTRLGNRRKLNVELSKALEHCREHNCFGSIIFIDLDQFKSINDLMGHEIGDEILRQVAHRLISLQKSGHSITRFGGDEFIYLLPNLGGDARQAVKLSEMIAKEINETLNITFVVDGACYNVGCSMGIELFPRDNQSDVDVIKNADLAMYEAKSSRLKNYMMYSPEMSTKLSSRLTYTRDLREAIDKGEFCVFYQPQYDENNRLFGAEALLRWNRSKYHGVSPAEYIPIAEESELIHQIGNWVITKVCHHLAELEAAGLDSSFKHISVNVSGKQLGADAFVENLCDIVKDAKVSPSRLRVEITENTLIKNIDTAIDMVSELDAFGIKCAIDDFGTGYSSLSYLKKLPTSTIKIDRAFVKGIDQDADNQSIAKMIIALGETFGMEVIAEGIESELELDCLKKIGCNKYQGYHFCRPISFQEFSQLVKTQAVFS